MENLKQKISEEVKKLGMIKSTSSDYKMVKYSQDDIIDLVTEVAQNELDSFSLKFMDYLDYYDTYKNHEGRYVHGKNIGTFTPEEVLNNFKSFLKIKENN